MVARDIIDKIHANLGKSPSPLLMETRQKLAREAVMSGEARGVEGISKATYGRWQEADKQAKAMRAELAKKSNPTRLEEREAKRAEEIAWELEQSAKIWKQVADEAAAAKNQPQ